MSRFTLNPSDPQTVMIQRTNVADMQSAVQAVLNSLQNRLLSAISLRGSGHGSWFTVMVEHTTDADIEGIDPAAAASGLRMYYGTSQAALQSGFDAALVAAQAANPNDNLADSEVSGSATAAVFWGFVIVAKQLLTPSVIFPAIRPGADPALLPVEVGPTYGWLMVVDAAVYVEFPLDPDLDRTQPIILGVGWAPAGSENNTTISWSAAIGVEEDGSDVTVVTDTVTALNTPAPPVAATYERTPIVIPAIDLTATADEIHAKISRVASGADPILPPGLHHIAVIQQRSR